MGSGDDVTLAIVCRTDLVPAPAPAAAPEAMPEADAAGTAEVADE